MNDWVYHTHHVAATSPGMGTFILVAPTRVYVSDDTRAVWIDEAHLTNLMPPGILLDYLQDRYPVLEGIALPRYARPRAVPRWLCQWAFCSDESANTSPGADCGFVCAFLDSREGCMVRIGALHALGVWLDATVPGSPLEMVLRFADLRPGKEISEISRDLLATLN